MLCCQSSGAGWLRAPNFGSATANYHLGEGTGSLRCDLATVIEVRAAGRGVLVLADGTMLDIRLTDVEAGVARFTFVEPHGGRRRVS